MKPDIPNLLKSDILILLRQLVRPSLIGWRLLGA